ncbi:TPA: hypothetical protein DEO28_03740 [Candidatus Dependentiae bacterium]|nr:MAG: hypothetical protein UR14_C0007G0049 [candidate division TM6 bacterium GW2011_GWE2_31_21]KKP53590.1 MAG: hypothetical protein UR43_C0004G0131 [candidate division TM6 bacterium GW2011_GWF2_33_332]HBS48170.1 hypothetical protein [Candidatus Dependentiae bacterium]HBZ73594.1 hypothetical protein [Candidatus Dependentiae bacterium]
MISEKQILKVSIFGKDYSIATDENQEHILKAAKLLDDLLKVIANGSSTVDHKIVVLAALQMATDLVKQKNFNDILEVKVNELVKLIDDSLIVC